MKANRTAVRRSALIVLVGALLGYVYVACFGPVEVECSLLTLEHLGCFAVVISFMAYFLSYVFLFFNVVVIWWLNIVPPWWERAAWGFAIFLIHPFGVLIYYWVIYRRVSGDYQYSIVRRSG